MSKNKRIIRKSSCVLALFVYGAMVLNSVALTHAAVNTEVFMTAGETCQCEYMGDQQVEASVLLEKARARADYIHQSGFTYVDARQNPAFDDRERLVWCDRFVQWVLFDIGFTDLPKESGLVVRNSDSIHDLSA